MAVSLFEKLMDPRLVAGGACMLHFSAYAVRKVGSQEGS